MTWAVIAGLVVGLIVGVVIGAFWASASILGNTLGSRKVGR